VRRPWPGGGSCFGFLARGRGRWPDGPNEPNMLHGPRGQMGRKGLPGPDAAGGRKQTVKGNGAEISLGCE
jgi:hypothetical protein